jgi:hypothetical protein
MPVFFVCAYLTILVLSVIGWVMNIINIVNALGGELGALFIAQCIGVPFGPLGAILGWAV